MNQICHTKYTSKELLYYFTNRLPTIIIGKLISHNLIKVHWGRGLGNFGDCLQPLILRHYGLLPVFVSSDSQSDILLEGTILQNITSSYSGYILGTGGDNLPLFFPKAKIIAVRGKLTENNVSPKNESIILGDPGLLMTIIFPKALEQTYDLGVVPHFVDLNTEWLNLWKQRFGGQALIISPLQSPEAVVNQIKSCKAIVSSSLHGLIVADSYHIPNLRIVSRRTMPNSFYDFKFDDYYSSLCLSQYPFLEVTGEETIEMLLNSTTIKPIDTIDKIIKDLDTSLCKVSKNFKKT